MNIATLLQFLASGSLDPGLDLDKERGPCTPYAEDAVSCIRNDAGLSYKMAKMCVLCPFKNARKSVATTCHAYRKEGFCEDWWMCKQTDCPSQCADEVQTLMNCYLDKVGCDGLCDDSSSDSDSSTDRGPSDSGERRSLPSGAATRMPSSQPATRLGRSIA
mmetsp:Transcript_8561/g.19685  ORF Transcript_8561/g.19685 Transcript_8561/m.19685 type:complete len:161 (+) Transcript_8561:373-855(+)